MAMSPSQEAGGVTFSKQADLPKLPIPKLKETCERYLQSLKALQVSVGKTRWESDIAHDTREHVAQTDQDHEETKSVVQEFLKVCY